MAAATEARSFSFTPGTAMLVADACRIVAGLFRLSKTRPTGHMLVDVQCEALVMTSETVGEVHAALDARAEKLEAVAAALMRDVVDLSKPGSA